MEPLIKEKDPVIRNIKGAIREYDEGNMDALGTIMAIMKGIRTHASMLNELVKYFNPLS